MDEPLRCPFCGKELPPRELWEHIPVCPKRKEGYHAAMNIEEVEDVDILPPAFILGRALAHWANQPPIRTPEEREQATVEYYRVLEQVCETWGLQVIKRGSA